MAAFEEDIPAFPMWKMFYDTIELLEQDYAESKIEHLAKIINSQKLIHIFVYNADDSIPYAKYISMYQKYKGFTIWLLGRFFFLSSLSNLSRIHKLVTNVQLRILHLISISQPHMYHEIASEYADTLSLLNQYKESDKLELNIFKVVGFEDLEDQMQLASLKILVGSKKTCDELKKLVLVFIHHILMEMFESYLINDAFTRYLDAIIHVLKEDDTNLKLSVLEIYKNCLGNTVTKIDHLPPHIVERFNMIATSLELFFYDLCASKIKVDKDYFQKIESIFVFILNNDSNFCNNSKMRTSKFIVNKLCFEDNDLNFAVSEELQIICCHVLLREETFYESLFNNKWTTNIVYKSIVVALELITWKILRDFEEFDRLNPVCIMDNVSVVWHDVSTLVKEKLHHNMCNGGCELEQTLLLLEKIVNMIVKVKIKLNTALPKINSNVEFFNETEFIVLLLSYVNFHITNCKATFPHNIFAGIIMKSPIYLSTKNIEIIFHLVAYEFLTLFYKTNNELPVNIYGRCDKMYARETLKQMYRNLALLHENKNVALKNVCDFLCLLECELTNSIDDINRHNLERNFVKIFSDIYTKRPTQLQNTMVKYVPNLISYCKNVDFIPRLMLHMCEGDTAQSMVEILPISICLLCSNYVRVTKFCNKERGIKIEYQCTVCDSEKRIDDKPLKMSVIDSQNPEQLWIVSDVITTKKHNINVNDVFKNIWSLSKSSNFITLRKFVRVLLPLSAHVQAFHTVEIAKDWVTYTSHTDKSVRYEISRVVNRILLPCQGNEVAKKPTKSEIIKIFLEHLFKMTKNSLQYSNYDLQQTLLQTIDQIMELKVKPVPLETMRMLLYFIMIPTSKYPETIESRLLELARNHDTKPLLLYGKYRRDICQYIVDLCAINQALVQYTMSKSLESVSVALGFLSVKDFLCKENGYLMPHLVALIVIMPDVLRLIKEVAELTDNDEGELLANNYGGIFIYLFLNKTEKEFKDSMKYIESKTGLTTPVLRKRNFRIILNELLLNFHDKRDRVLIALKLLATEDTDGDPMQVRKLPDYLQPRFLGVLQYFDTKQFARKQVLLSLAAIFKFMGAKRMAPFRFKVIAMLRTALNFNYGTYPALNCNVWEAFVKNCDIECLGGQLAVIFVSLLPLSESYPEKINGIFSYLILENENLLREYIPDLFFVLDYNVAPEIQNVIRKYVEQYENKSFSERLKYLSKYLTHETNEMKIHSLKHIKRLVEKNRSELDHMILRYNGMDSTIVEILEILTVGCREKDQALRLACGECMGEFGAIEPSHLPRKCTEAQTFCFFMTEDTFITNSLQELIRALQAEKNTTVMDRFALAIQETLKIYGISPGTNAPKHVIWDSFAQYQKELIVPFLSSRYTMGQKMEPVTFSPIFGSIAGSTFQTWSQNWTCVLIGAIKSDRKNVLQVCFPSMKQNHRTLMHFLPHILLHSLLEGSADNLERCHEEFVTIIQSFENIKTVPDNNQADNKNSQPHHSANPNKFLCMKVIFVLLDFLDRWIREWQWQKGAAGREDQDYRKICFFMSKFCKLQLAKCSYECGEYSRALLYIEDYIAMHPKELDKHLFLLAKINAELDEPDAVSGVAALHNKEPTSEQRILELEVSGKLSDAVACYERIPPPLKLQHLQGLMQCYLDLDNVTTAFNFIEGAIQKQPEYEGFLLEMQTKPLWRLGRYEELNKLMENPYLIENLSWGVKLGQALLQIQNGERDEFNNTLRFLRSQQVDVIGATSLEEGVYQHGYSSIVKLHSLNELDQVEKVIHQLLSKANDHKAIETIIKKLSTEWELRTKVVQESTKIIEPILCLRRVVLNQAKRIIKDKVPAAIPFIDSLLGELWLISAKIARKAGIHQQAYTYTLKAEEYSPPKLFMERAKIHWLREEYQQALTVLTRGVEELPQELLNDTQSQNRKMCAKAKLLIATYNDKISNVNSEVNTVHYKSAIEMNKEWEKSYVLLAQYYDRMFQTFVGDDRDAKGSTIQVHMINYFGKSMLYGSNYIYQSMPRMLSVWFDYGTRLLEAPSNVKEERKQILLQMTKLIDNFLERLPSYLFLTAFSQIISRICHPQREVYIELRSIIIKLLLQYPQHTMWMMISVIKSSYSIRSRRCTEILGDPKLKQPAMLKLVTDFTRLAEKLIELCNKEIPDTVNVTNINVLLRSLPRLLSKDGFSQIMIPTQKFRKLVMPNPDFKSAQHNPFPNHYVHIVGIEDEVVLLSSLQRPRKITFKGSDGKRYIQMLKPKDDLRKDFRLMEFNDIVNQMLSKEPNSRQRRLNIRLYSVVPLNEECGLIEWIPNLVGLRPILVTIYAQKGQLMRNRELRDAACNLRDPLRKKREIFEQKFLPRHPPVLSDWFRRTFPDVQGWLAARTAYTRTTAVMSMVGYILGLGDRHGENILLDSTNGDTVHVDFNCLFNKGETFEWPERVPFRLTHNMVSAMGPLAVEGIFRESCACTLKVLRAHTDTLMSIVTPFVYDPLVSWPRNNPTTSNMQNAERTNEQAVEHVRDIKLRLQGITKTGARFHSIALSVDGQINNIIEEATSIDNLCQMFLGWGAFL